MVVFFSSFEVSVLFLSGFGGLVSLVLFGVFGFGFVVGLELLWFSFCCFPCGVLILKQPLPAWLLGLA